MLRVSTFLLFAAVLLAQKPAKEAEQVPPPEVDRALRARITEFLNYHITGQFRKAETMVAEDSKDFFYNSQKSRYMSCSGIENIRYSDEFTKAYAVVLCTVPMLLPGNDHDVDSDVPAAFMRPPTVPIPSTWKLEDGKWCWYMDPDTARRMPFGLLPTLPKGITTPSGTMLSMVPPPPGTTIPTPPAAFGGDPQSTTMDPAMVAALKAATNVPVTDATFGAVPEEALNHVKLDPASVELKAGGEAKVKVSNDSEDARALMILGQIPGVEFKLDAPSLDGKSSTALNFKAGKDAKSGTIQLVVATTGEMIPVRVTVK